MQHDYTINYLKIAGDILEKVKKYDGPKDLKGQLDEIIMDAQEEVTGKRPTRANLSVGSGDLEKFNKVLGKKLIENHYVNAKGEVKFNFR